MIQEKIELGHRITRWSLDAYYNGKWNGIASNKQSIGYKRLLKFDEIISPQVRLRITEGKGCPALHTFGIYKSAFTPTPSVKATPPSPPAGNRITAAGGFRFSGNRLLLPGEFAGGKVLVDIYDLAGRAVWRGLVQEDGVVIPLQGKIGNRVFFIRCGSEDRYINFFQVYVQRQ